VCDAFTVAYNTLRLWSLHYWSLCTNR